MAAVVIAALATWIVARYGTPDAGDLRAEASGRLLAPVQMTLYGGAAGLDDLVVVRPSGAYVVQLGGLTTVTGRLAPAEVRALAREVAHANLRVLPLPDPTKGCCDLQYLTITYGPRSYQSDGGLAGLAKPLGLKLETLLEQGRARLVPPS